MPSASYIELDRLDEAKALLDQQIKFLGETRGDTVQVYEIAGRAGRPRHGRSDMRRARERARTEASFLQLRSAELATIGRFRESQQLGARAVDLLQQQGQTQRATLVMSEPGDSRRDAHQNAERAKATPDCR